MTRHDDRYDYPDPSNFPSLREQIRRTWSAAKIWVFALGVILFLMGLTLKDHLQWRMPATESIQRSQSEYSRNTITPAARRRIAELLKQLLSEAGIPETQIVNLECQNVTSRSYVPDTVGLWHVTATYTTVPDQDSTGVKRLIVVDGDMVTDGEPRTRRITANDILLANDFPENVPHINVSDRPGR